MPNAQRRRSSERSRAHTRRWRCKREIAAVLGAIDDLIENNRRRIALLEQMAQAIYREWFVRFRYPGHEDDELVDSPLGPIPAGLGALGHSATFADCRYRQRPEARRVRATARSGLADDRDVAHGWTRPPITDELA